jgi:competence protein ComEC
LDVDAHPGGAVPVAPARLRLTVPQNLPLLAGDRVRFWATVRIPPRHRNPGARPPPPGRTAAFGRVKSARLIMRTEIGGPSFERAVDRLRVRLRARIGRSFASDGRARSLVTALLLGERESLAPATVRRLRAAGLAHLLAISGLHVGLLVLPLVALATRVGLRGRVLALVAAPLLALHATLVGAPPSVLRAAGMSWLWLAGRALGRDGDTCNLLAWVAVLLALQDPLLIAAPGYQLSFAATAAIVTLRPGARALSLCAYAATAPLLALHFGRLTPFAPLTNLLAIPLLPVLLFFAILSLAVPAVGPVALLLVRALLRLAETFAEMPGAVLQAEPPPLWLWTALALSAWLSLRRMARWRRSTWLLPLALLHVGPAPLDGGPPRLWVLDVGQGQAVLLRGPSGWSLVDAGGSAGGRFDVGARVVAPALRALGCRRLDALILTHEDDDHSGGARALLETLDVGELWLPPGAIADPRLRELAAFAHSRGTPLRLVRRGDRAQPSGIPLAVLHPTPEDAGLPANERSLVLYLEPNGGTLIPGDLGFAGERLLLVRGDVPPVRLLVAGHHGSARSTGTAWLDACAPHTVFVSAGRGNRFGHPHRRLLERLAEHGCAVRGTDRGGCLSWP